jgi:hypothetical protein
MEISKNILDTYLGLELIRLDDELDMVVEEIGRLKDEVCGLNVLCGH